MKSTLYQSQQSILKISQQRIKTKTSQSPEIKKKRVKSATNFQSYIINSTTRDEETTRTIMDSNILDIVNYNNEKVEDDQKIEQYNYQHEKDQCYITHLQQQVMDLEFSLALKKDQNKRIMQPFKKNATMLTQKLQTLEQAKINYVQELDKLSSCLEEVLNHNHQIQLAYQKKCEEIEKMKSLRNIP